MGYRSDVSIICEEKAFEMLKEVWYEIDFEPDKVLSNDNNEYIIQWEFVEWYHNLPAIEMLEEVLNMLDEEYDEMKGYAYKEIRVGTDGAVEENCNTRGSEIYDEVLCLESTVVVPSDFAV